MRNTKIYKKREMAGILDKYQTDELFRNEDVLAVNKITGWNFTAYKKAAQPYGGYANSPRHLAHQENDGCWKIWSWNKAIDGIGDFNPKNLFQALRRAVREEAADYLKSSRKNCAECGSVNSLCVDHKDIPFIVLANQFVREVPQVKGCISNNADGRGWFINDFNILCAWRSEHWVKAKFQVLCQKCNSKKGALVLCP